MRTAVLRLVVLTAILNFQTAELHPASMPREYTLKDTPRPIRVDAKLKDWPTSRVFQMDRPEFVSEGKGFWRDPSYGSAKVYLTYDAEYLYLAAVVLQDHGAMNSREGAEIWNGDCVELMLSSRSGGDVSFFARGDTHIGLTPGDGASRPRAWCFDRDREPQGSRVAARRTNGGYLLEAALPLALFGGLKVGPSRSARLNVAVGFAGPVSGNRIFTLDLSGHERSWRNPAAWPLAVFEGATTVTVPEAEVYDPGSRRVLEGTKGSTLLAVGEVTGRVVDGKGRGIPGCQVRMWPRSAEGWTGSGGDFRLTKAKTYDTTVLTASRDGFLTAFRPARASTAPLTLHPLPAGPLLGTDLPVEAGKGVALLADCPSDPAGWEGLAAVLGSDRGRPVVLRVDATIGPFEAASRVRTCNLERRLGVGTWIVSFAAGPPGDPYALLNAYRSFYNAMRTADPTITVAGPDLPFESGADWMAPLLRHDGDILDALAIRFDPEGSPQRSLAEVQWDVSSALRRLQYATGALAGRRIPLILVGQAAASGPTVAEGSRRPALWGTVLAEAASREAALFGFCSFPPGKDVPVLLDGFLDACRSLKGEPVACGSTVEGLAIQAVRAAGDLSEVRVVVANLGGRDDRTLKVSLGEKSGDVWVDLGLGKRIEANLPGHGILRITLDPKGVVKEKKRFEATRGK